VRGSVIAAEVVSFEFKTGFRSACDIISVWVLIAAVSPEKNKRIFNA
jgi:hypothetical protein